MNGQFVIGMQNQNGEVLAEVEGGWLRLVVTDSCECGECTLQPADAHSLADWIKANVPKES